MAVVAMTAIPSQAEQQLFTFAVNKHAGTGTGTSYHGVGCDFDGNNHNPDCMTFVTTSSQAGAIREAGDSLGIGTQGGQISGGHTRLSDAFDGYGELSGGTSGGGGSPFAPIGPSHGGLTYGGLTVTRAVDTTHGIIDADNPDGTTAITSIYTAHGLPNVGRFFETFTNNTGSTIDTIVSYTNNLGSDAATKYFSADPATNVMTIGSNTGTDPHPQFLTSEQYSQGNAFSAGDPTITAVFGNNTNFLNANFTAYHQDGSDLPNWTFHIVLAPGQTMTLMTFVLLTGDMDRNDPTDNFGADGVTGTPDGIPDVLEKDITLGAQMANILLNGGQSIDPDSWIFAGLTVDQAEELANFNVASTEIDNSQAFFDENSYAARQTPATFNGGTLKPTTSHTFTQDFTIDAAGGTVDDTNGNVKFTGTLSGAGGFTVTGANGVILSADNTYTGVTKVESGTLQLGDGGASGAVAGNIDIAANGILTVYRSDDATFSNKISGTGFIQKFGANTVTLTGNSSFSGVTQVVQGTLAVDGSLAHSTVIAEHDATLSGHGTVGIASVQKGGTIAPGGDDIATLHVGQLGMSPGGIYQANIATDGTSDLIAATGSANVEGSLLDIALGGGTYSVGEKFKLVSSDKLVGSFSGFNLSANLSSAVRPELQYEGNDVYLYLAPNALTPSLGTASPNQLSIAQSIDTLLASGKGDAFLPLFGLSHEALLRVLDELSGEIASTGQQASMDLSTQFLNMVIDPFLDARGGLAGAGGPALAFAPQKPKGFHVSLAMQQGPQSSNSGYRFANNLAANAANSQAPTGTITASAVGGPLGVWVSGYGNVAHSDGSSSTGSHSTRATNAGVAAGIDFRLSDSFVLGAAGGAARMNFHPSDSLGSGKANVTQVGFYMSKSFDEDAYLSLAGSYSGYRLHTTRVVGGTNKYAAHYDAHDYGVRLEGGKSLWTVDSLVVTPYAALVANHFATPAYAETTIAGASAFALSHPFETHSESTGELGFKFDTATQTEQVFFLHATAAWQHEFTPVSNYSVASFAAVGGPDFVIQGAAAPKNAALLSLGADTSFAEGFSIGLRVNTLLSGRTTSYGGTGSIQYRW